MPLALLYGLITAFRNKLYDRGILKSYQSSIFSICIGNLQVGGTGKTPHTAWMYNWLSMHFKVGILSRGYGRKTKGLIEANENAIPTSIGDEPYWYYNTLKNAKVVVAEKRVIGMQYFEKQKPLLDFILLDDAFQHRALKCNLNIILSEYERLYIDDKMMPQGRLREWKTGEKRAEIIIVSKCPANLTLNKKIDLIHAINPFEYQDVFFTSLMPSLPFVLKGNAKFDTKNMRQIIAVSGIANNKSFIELCNRYSSDVRPISYPDHYNYTIQDINEIVALVNEGSIIITTEKDAVKLKTAPFLSLLPENKVFVLPIVPMLLFNEEEKFKQLLMQYHRKRLNPISEKSVVF